MKEDTACALLRLIAVATAFAGLILATMSLVGWTSVEVVSRRYATYVPNLAPGVLVDRGWPDLVASLLVALWGFVLYAASKRLARCIVK